MSSRLVMPPLATTGNPARPGDAAVSLHVDARLHAVAGDVGEDEVAEPLAAQFPHDPVEAAGHAVAPAVDLDLTIPGGDVRHDQAAKAPGHDLGKRRLANEHRAEGDALGTHVAELVDAREGAHAAPYVDGQALDGADGADGLVVGGAGLLVLLEGAREVDDVDPLGSLPEEVASDGGRIV